MTSATKCMNACKHLPDNVHKHSEQSIVYNRSLKTMVHLQYKLSMLIKRAQPGFDTQA